MITDLDSYEAEDEIEDEDSGVVSINSPLLEQIKKQWSFAPDEVTQRKMSQALVLFRPLPIPGVERYEQEKPPKEVENGNKMDVGP